MNFELRVLRGDRVFCAHWRTLDCHPARSRRDEISMVELKLWRDPGHRDRSPSCAGDPEWPEETRGQSHSLNDANQATTGKRTRSGRVQDVRRGDATCRRCFMAGADGAVTINAKALPPTKARLQCPDPLHGMHVPDFVGRGATLREPLHAFAPDKQRVQETLFFIVNLMGHVLASVSVRWEITIHDGA